MFLRIIWMVIIYFVLVLHSGKFYGILRNFILDGRRTLTCMFQLVIKSLTSHYVNIAIQIDIFSVSAFER